MAQLPSELGFVSFLQYAVRGTTELSRKSTLIAHAVKVDGAVDRFQIIPYSAEQLSQEISKHPCLAECFGKDVVLIPVPRSAPLKRDALWPAKQICTNLFRAGLGGQVLTCLERINPVQKSAFADRGMRPMPPDHFASTAIRATLFDASERITLVDDVITRGSSFIGMYPHLLKAFPTSQIRCFALLRAISKGEITAVRDPVAGIITYSKGKLHREP